MIRVYTKLITDEGRAGLIYCLARFFDVKGKGWLRIKLSFLAKKINLTKRSVIRNLKRLLKLGWLHSLEITKDVIYLKYASLAMVDKLVEGSAALFLLENKEILDIKLVRQAAYEAALIAQQERTRYSILKDQANQKKYVELDESSSFLRNRRCCGFNPRSNSIFLKKNTKVAGAKQETVGNQLGRSRGTINRYARKTKSVKVHIEQTKTRLPENWQSDKRYWVFAEIKSAKTFSLTLKSGEQRKYTVTKKRSKVFRKMPNFYQSELKVSPLRVENNNKRHKLDTKARKWDQLANKYRKLPLAKVLTNLTHEQLILLAHSFMLYFKGQTHPIISTWSSEEICNNIQMTLKNALNEEPSDELSPEQLVIELALRIINPVRMSPLPSGIYELISPNFNELTKSAIAGTRLDIAEVQVSAARSIYPLQETERFVPTKRRLGRLTKETALDYVKRTLNKKRLQKLLSTLILISVDEPWCVDVNESYEEMVLQIEYLEVPTFLDKSKDQLIRYCTRRILRNKSAIPHYDLCKLESQKNFSLSYLLSCN